MQIRRRPGALILALAGLLTSACEDDAALTQLQADAAFEPDAVDFGKVGVGTVKALPIVLRNRGSLAVTIDDLRVPPDFSLRGPKANLLGQTVPAGAEVSFELVFAPPATEVRAEVLAVAFEGGTAELDIRAEGAFDGVASLAIEPAAVEFGAQPVGAPARRTVTIRNTLPVDAIIESARRRSNGSDAVAPGRLAIDGLFPLSVPSGQGVPVTVVFSPTAETSAAETFEFTARDLPPLVLNASGRGVSTDGAFSCGLGPIDFGALERGTSQRQLIRCSASGGTVLVNSVTLSGPSDFRLPMPASGQAVPAGTALDIPVEFLALGSVGFRNGQLFLRFTDASGPQELRFDLRGRVSEPAPSATAMSLELTWNTDNTDLDLHLTGPGGIPFTFRDCYFAESAADWGVPDDASDDCFLDRDDRNGFGPERINVGRAEPGTYGVYIHYYADNRRGASDASVTVNLGGQQVGQFQRSSLRCNDLWHVGDIQWTGNSGTFQSIDRIDRSTFGECP